MERKKRASHTRSKHGCLTCRIRKIKCDEEKPSCFKCSSTGRACEWFRETRGEPTKESAISSPPSLHQMILAQIPDAKALELRGFEFFLARTAPEMVFFDSEFWQLLAQQLSWSEPVVLHAAIALGTLHENEESFGMLVSKDRMSSSRHRFGVAQYNKAIHLLTTRKLDGDLGFRAATLATCLIFVHIELLRGRYDPAIAHIRAGLSILPGGGQESKQGSVDSVLRTAFARLDLQCAHFDRDGPVLPYRRDNLALIKPLVPYTGTEQPVEVKGQCDKLIGYAFAFYEKCKNLRASQSNLRHITLVEEQTELIRFLSAYRNKLGALADHTDIDSNSGLWQSVVLLKMQIIALFTITSVCLADDEESMYDGHINDFSEIICLVEQFMSSKFGSQHRHSNRPSLVTDMGIIAPLYQTATKCRDPLIRRRAIAILESWPHREGLWDSGLILKIARQVVEIEEGGAMLDVPQDSSQLIRTTNVGTTVADDQTYGTMKFRRTSGKDKFVEESCKIAL